MKVTTKCCKSVNIKATVLQIVHKQYPITKRLNNLKIYFKRRKVLKINWCSHFVVQILTIDTSSGEVVWQDEGNMQLIDLLLCKPGFLSVTRGNCAETSKTFFLRQPNLVKHNKNHSTHTSRLS